MIWERYSFYIVASILAVLSWWLVQWYIPETSEDINLQQSHNAEFYSKGYVKWEMGPDGELASKLSADEMIRYSGNGTTQMRNPKLTLYTPDKPAWIVESSTGTLSADGKEVFLKGKARLTRDEAPGFDPLQINSSNVRVKPETAFAKTNEWAELLSPSSRTEGIGMELKYSDPIKIKLFSKVRGKYVLK